MPIYALAATKPQNKPGPITSTAAWLQHYQANVADQHAISWERGAELTPAEAKAIIPSLQTWQLGETSDGSHLLAAAQQYAEAVQDPQFVNVVQLFIQEEQRHGETLGQFLDLAGMPRIRRNWGDSAFRLIRYWRLNMELWTTTVIMVETVALVYYNALRQATQSTVLRQVCKQILKHEVSHLQFQYERLAILHRHRPKWLRQLTYFIQRGFFAAIILAVWLGHRHAFRAGGHTFASFISTLWRKMHFSWQRMQPEWYRWPPESSAPQAASSVRKGIQLDEEIAKDRVALHKVGAADEVA